MGTRASVVVRYNNARGEEKDVATFRGPFVKRAIPSHIPRDQSMRVKFEGRFLGNKNRVTHVTVDDKQCSGLELIDDHLLSCIVPKGNSGFANVKVFVGKDSSSFGNVLRREGVKISVRQVWRSEEERPKQYNVSDANATRLAIPFWIKTNLTIRLLSSGIAPDTQVNVSIAGKSCETRGFPKQVVNEKPNSDFDERFVQCTWGPDVGPVGFGASHVKISFKDSYGTVHSSESKLSLIDVKTPEFTMAPESLAFYGGEEVSLHYKESDGGIADAKSIKVFIGAGECKGLKIDGNHLTCTAPRGAIGKAHVIIQRDGRIKANVLSARFDRPLIRHVSPPIGPVMGGNILTVEGRHFKGSLVVVKIGGKECIGVNVTSSETLECEVPESDVR